MEYMTGSNQTEAGKPEMNFKYELIFVILNEGHTDEVMDAAKGTGLMQTEKFRGLSLATEREVLLIVASTAKKAAIMQAILEKAGPDSGAGAVCFSLPVSQVAGLRRLDEEEE